MYKVFMFIVCSVLSNYCSAQNIPQNNLCSNQKPSYTFKANEQKIAYNLNLSVRDLANSGNTTYMRSGTFHKVGEFRGGFTSRISFKKNYYTRNNRLLCTYISEVAINLDFIPSIYIAKEIQPYKCTYQRVINHEYKHYMNFHNGALILHRQLPQVTAKYFDNINIYTNSDASAKIQFQNLQNELMTLLTNYTNPLDSAMDTQSNYAYESSLCGDYERALIFKALTT